MYYFTMHVPVIVDMLDVLKYVNIFNEVMRLHYFWFHFQHSKIQFNQEVNFIFIHFYALYSIE